MTREKPGQHRIPQRVSRYLDLGKRSTRFVSALPFILSLVLLGLPFSPTAGAGSTDSSRGRAPLSVISSQERLSSPNVFMGATHFDEQEILTHVDVDAVWGDNFESPASEAQLSRNVIRNQRKGIGYYTNISAFEPFAKTLEEEPELNDSTCLDVDLNPVTMEAGFQVILPLMDTLEPGWQQFLREQVQRAIAGGAEGVIIDEIQGTSLRGGCFNNPDMAGFRQFLGERFTAIELSSQFGITDVDTFDYGEFIRSNGLSQTWKTQKHEVPLSQEFQIFQNIAVQGFWNHLVSESKQQAEQEQGRDFLFSANVSALEQFSIMFAAPLDFYTLEFPYFDITGFPPRGKTIPASKLSRAFGSTKALFLTQVPTNAELVRRGNIDHLMKIYIAESYAARSEFMVPFKVFSGGPVPYSADLTLVAPYYQFIRENRFLYQDLQDVDTRVALLYSFPSNFYRGFEFLNGFYGTSYALLDSQIPHDVLFSGDDLMLPDTLTAEQLQGYAFLILADTANLSDSQISIILDFAAAGGAVLAWDQVGLFDEENRAVSTPERIQLQSLTVPGTHALGQGTFEYFSQDLGNSYLEQRTIEARDLIGQKILTRVEPQVLVTAPNNVDVLSYTNRNGDSLILHVINYNYDIDTDTVATIPSWDISVALPDGFSLQNKQLYLLSPDRDVPELLSWQQNLNSISATVSQTNFYDVLFLTTESFASDQAALWEDRARRAFLEVDFLGLDTSSLAPRFDDIETAVSESNHLKAKVISSRILASLKDLGKPVVLFDEAHGELNTLSQERALQLNPENPEFSLFGDFREDVSNDYVLSSLFEGTITTATLQGKDVLILAAPSDPSLAPEERIFSSSEVEAMVEFVHGGGGLLFLGDCCLFNFVATESSITDLLSTFEIQFIPGGLRTLNPADPNLSFIFDVTDFEPHPVSSNLGPIQAIGPGNLTVAGDARVLALTGSDTFRDPNGNDMQDADEERGPLIFAAAARFGSGKVVVLADNDFTDPIYANVESQRTLIRNALAWLSSREELFLTRFESSQDDFTGLAFYNPGPLDANLLLKALGPDGRLVAGAGINNPETLEVPAGQQVASLTQDIFGAGIRGEAGWIEVLSSGGALAGFSLQGDGLTALDGTDFQTQRSSQLIFPEIVPGQESFAKIFLANPDDDKTAHLRLSLFEEGNRLESILTTIPASGSLEFDPEDFSVTFDAEKSFVEASSDIEIVATAIFGDEQAVGALNASSVDDKQPRRSVLYSAQLASGSSFFTHINVANPSNLAADLTLTAFDESGSPRGSGLNLTLLPGQQIRGEASQLFSLSPPQGEALTDGWVKVESDNEAVVGSVRFGDPGGTFLASLPLESQTARESIFSHVSQGGENWTGIALLNPSSLAANVTIEVFESQGGAAGQASLLLGPGQRVSKLLNQYIPELADQFGGFIRIRSDRGIVAFQLFGSNNFLSAVPSQ